MQYSVVVVFSSRRQTVLVRESIFVFRLSVCLCGCFAGGDGGCCAQQEQAAGVGKDEAVERVCDVCGDLKWSWG